MKPKNYITPRQRMALQHFAVDVLGELLEGTLWDASGEIGATAQRYGLLTGSPEAGYRPAAYVKRLVEGRLLT